MASLTVKLRVRGGPVSIRLKVILVSRNTVVPHTSGDIRVTC